MHLRSLFAFLSLLLPTIAIADDKPEIPPELKGLKYRMIGPAIGGRVSRSCGVPGDLNTYYAATAAGGVWKSTDGGFTWKPIFDDQPIAGMGSIAVSASDPNVIYAGSGEANIRGNVSPGNGIYKSTDAGKSWKQVWTSIGQIGTMIVHPTNPDIAFAAVLGNPFGPNVERGVYRTKDGGKNWEKVLFVDENTGASDVCFDPSNPRILFAGTWQTRRRPWELTSGGPGSGLYVSHDGGDTWDSLKDAKSAKEGLKPADKFLKNGLPNGIWGKVGVGVAASDSRRVYALIEADEGGLFRSNDGGESWSRVNSERILRQRAWYYTTFTIDPTNADVIWVPQVPLLKSIDGGKSFQRVPGYHHGDMHDVWIDPKNPKRVIASNDGGVDISTNGGESWYAPPLPIAQFYHVAVDNREPYHVAGCVQDIGSAAGPSDSLSQKIFLSDWYNVGGGEAGYAVFDWSDPNIVYAGEYGGTITRYDHRTRQSRNVSIYPFNPSGHGAADLKYRFQWTAPIMISPHDAKTVYHGANVLFRTHDAGVTWEKISPDLTRNDKNKQKWSGGPITGDNTGVETYDTIFAIAESPVTKGIIWAGSDDGLVHVSRNNGKTWTNVTPNIADVPDWGTVQCIEASPYDAGTAYVVVDNHRMSDFSPHIWKTIDFGKTWKSIHDTLPKDEYLHVVREDPKQKNLLYAGSEKGVYFSRNGGQKWEPLKLEMPTAAVHDLVVKNDDLVVCTMGRSIWILDDLTPVRQAKTSGLFAPRPTYRWRGHFHITVPNDRSGGDNPPRGAIIYYQLPKEPAKNATLEVLDSAGKRVTIFESKNKEEKEDETMAEEAPPKPKKLNLPAEKGLNRVVWDLTWQGADVIPNARTDAGNPVDGPLALPGKYTLKFTVDGQTKTESLTVKPDPRLTISENVLDEQLKFSLQVREEITRLTKIVLDLRKVRKQVQERAALLAKDENARPLVEAGKKLSKKLDDLEGALHNPKAKVTYDILAQKGGAKLYSQFALLFEMTKEGDGLPTQGMKELNAELSADLDKRDKQWTTLLNSDATQYNALAQKLGVPPLLLPSAKAEPRKPMPEVGEK
ncbi:MAG TPA: hypothetical protein VKS79_03635 [Gemmataceae bacterium]|nr:hypothetical protein [Gemmataceae bacterium]